VCTPSPFTLYCSTLHYITHTANQSEITHYTVFQKTNDTALAWYNFDVHQPILIIFGRNVAEKVSSQTVLYFPTFNYCFCTTCRNSKAKIASFHLNAKCCFANRHTKHIHILTWPQLNRPSFSQESIVYTKQEIRSVEHGICPIAEFTSPYWIVRIVTEYRILYSVDVVMYMYCLKILSEYWKVTRLFKPLPWYRNF